MGYVKYREDNEEIILERCSRHGMKYESPEIISQYVWNDGKYSCERINEVHMAFEDWKRKSNEMKKQATVQ